ncbi:NAD(P)/FAD-dependent oxidoreductase [Microbacterium sp. SYP-A9085]|uniref:NAD(P)/FAD-dependent oxidoreductase n=1 Tax=Microbacterium sp. SYP-A9085 TaxID=2664454 RepID=UPI0020A65AB9|nr:FAD-dependent oxidoreductase [Microbacterium sp. SYP-A9085]
MERIVVVGGSVAGARTVQALRSGGFAGAVTVVEPEHGEAYDRPPLTKEYLSGAWSRQDLNLIPGGWESVGATVIHEAAASLDPGARQLTLADGSALGYDGLVIATGLAPRTLRAEDGGPIGHVLGQASGSDALRERMADGGEVVVVGGSFVAAEAACAARDKGLPVTVVSRSGALLERSLGAIVGRHITEVHESKGVRVLGGSQLVAITRDGEAAHVRVANDDNGEETTLRADILIAGIGSDPNTSWLNGSGIRVEDGVVTDARCRVLGAKDVYALGDVARFYDVHFAKPRRVGHWTHAVDQATVVAHNLLNRSSPMGYRPAPYFWIDQYGKKIQIAGEPDPDAHVDLLTLVGAVPREVAIYSEGDDNECSAVVTFGWPRGMAAARRLLHLDAKTSEMIVELEKLAAGPVPVFPV